MPRPYSGCQLDGRTIAIAGVGGGLGPLVAARLAAEGANVAGTDREQGTLAALQGELGIPAERWDGRAVDLLDEEAVRGWCAALVERFGRVDGLVHLVGGWRGGEPLHEAPLADWDLLHDLLIRTVQHTTRAFHDQLAGQRARALRPRLRQAGAGADQHQRRLRGREGRGRGLDPRLRRRVRAGRGDREHRRRRGDPDAADARGEPRQGIPDLHAGRAPRRRDRLPLLRCGGGDERPAPPPYDGPMSKKQKAAKAPAGKMTIGELARRTGMTIRNIRAHQTRGLLPPPEVHGRTGYYGEAHVARIELTREMQAEGLNLEAIRRVLESTDGSSQEIVDFARAVRAPFEDETPEIYEPDELAEPGRSTGSTRS